MVSEVGESGLPVAEVARRNGVHPSVLGRWCRKAAPATPGFLPVQVTTSNDVAAPAPEDRPSVEIVLTNGRRLIVPDSIAPNRLRALAAALEEA
jgi:transposase-like protein